MNVLLHHVTQPSYTSKAHQAYVLLILSGSLDDFATHVAMRVRNSERADVKNMYCESRTARCRNQLVVKQSNPPRAGVGGYDVVPIQYTSTLYHLVIHMINRLPYCT